MPTFPAFVATKADDQVHRTVEELADDDLPPGEVLVDVEWSSVNYKDALATIPKGGVARLDRLVPGIDLAGTVATSDDPSVAVGDRVLVHGYDLGVAHHGGFAARARVPAGWVVPLPDGLSTRQAMAIGTAGFTAALSVERLRAHGLQPGDGPVLVTGATGGVGSFAVAVLGRLGYEVVASTGKAEAAEWLRGLGARDVLDRAETSAESKRPLESERWAGAVDCVGGSTLAYVLRTLRYGAAVAASGNTGGIGLTTTVLPFILRGVHLIGIDSVQVPIEERRALWGRLAGELRPGDLDAMATAEVGLGELAGVLDRILQGGVQGRVLVDPRR